MIERPSKTGPGVLAHGLVMKKEIGDTIAREEAAEYIEVLCMQVHGMDYHEAGAKKGCLRCMGIYAADDEHHYGGPNEAVEPAQPVTTRSWWKPW